MRPPLQGSYAENSTTPRGVGNWVVGTYRAKRSLRRFFHRERLTDPGDLQVAHDAERVEDLQRDPGDVELVPGEAVAGGDGMRVMVVVPAFAEGQERHPPAVARIVACL